MHAPRRKWSQHWLANDELARALVTDMDPRPGDRFFEIGAGEGRLTRALLERRVSVVAIEIDPRCCALLRHLALVEPEGRLQVFEGDVLDVDPADIGLRAPVRLVGNLPYAVSSPILSWTIDRRDLAADAHYMLQAEVAQRLLAPPSSRERGLLSVRVQWFFEPTLVRRLGPGAFRPPPRVDSAFVRLQPRAAPEVRSADRHRDVVLEALFTHRRKTIANNLRHAGWPPPVAAAAVEAAGVDPGARAEALDLEALARLIDALPEAAT